MFSAGEYQHVVVLVHGTFARSASWTHPESPLATTVAKALGGSVLLKSFEWSGKNSHTARLSAGKDLAERLRSLSRSHPKASLQIVAHSHGGNVAAYALRSLEARDSVKGVVCLGTPFIAALPRDFAPTFRLLRFLNLMPTVGVAFLACLFAGGFGVAVFDPEFADQDIGGLIIGALLMLVVVGLLAFLAIRDY